MATLLQVIAGLALLTLGRKIFWLVVAVLGFTTAMTIARQLLPEQTEERVLLISIGAGLIGGLLAVFVQRVAIGVAGFLAGGFLALGLTQLIGMDPGTMGFMIGGVIGLVLVYPLFEWALMILSSLAGALVLALAFDLPPGAATAVFVAAFVLGLVIQGILRKRRAE